MRLFALLALLAGQQMFVGAEPAHAEPPPYLVLHVPAKPLPHQPTYSRYPGTEYNVSTHSYSYGWFGVQPRRHWSRHLGYYRNFTQWSAK